MGPGRRADRMPTSKISKRSIGPSSWSRELHDGRVAEAERGGNRPEGRPETRARLVRRVGILDAGPAHLEVLLGQAGHRVRELQGGYAVQLEQAAPAEGGEYL